MRGSKRYEKVSVSPDWTTEQRDAQRELVKQLKTKEQREPHSQINVFTSTEIRKCVPIIT